jgi:hypothetical protein
MIKNTPTSLSIQKEIEKRHMVLESEIDKSFDELSFRTMLHRAGISKEKGWSPVSLLFALVIVPLLKESVMGLWSGKYFARLLRAQKDSYYRFINHPQFNWRKLVTLLVSRLTARLDQAVFNEKVLIADDTLLHKTGREMELVSYHFDHTHKRSQLGYQMLQLGYHNGTDFYPVDLAFHTSKDRPNQRLRDMDRRSTGWKRRQEAFEKKTEVLVEMLRRCWQNGISARFVLFDSWFAHDNLISQIVAIGYGVICQLKRGKTRYLYNGQSLTLPQLWHTVARHRLQWVSSWKINATKLEVEMPHSGTVAVVFVRWSKKNWHVFLSTEPDLEIATVLDYYARRWAIEVYFKDCKQLLDLGKGQSETFDAVVALASIVMIRYLLLVHILAKKQVRGPIGPLFQQLAYEHLQLGLIHSLWTRVREVIMLSSQLFCEDLSSERFLYILDLIESCMFSMQPNCGAKL